GRDYPESCQRESNDPLPSPGAPDFGGAGDNGCAFVGELPLLATVCLHFKSRRRRYVARKQNAGAQSAPPAEIDSSSLARRFARIALGPARAWIKRRRGNSADLAEIAERFDFVSLRNYKNVAGSERAKGCRCHVNRQHGSQQLNPGTAAANSRHCICPGLFGCAR